MRNPSRQLLELVQLLQGTRSGRRKKKVEEDRRKQSKQRGSRKANHANKDTMASEEKRED
jgi:hypothetical protein